MIALIKKLLLWGLLGCGIAAVALSPAAKTLTGHKDLHSPVGSDVVLLARTMDLRYSAAAGILGPDAVYTYRLLIPRQIPALRAELWGGGRILPGCIRDRSGVTYITFDPVSRDFVPAALRFYADDLPIYYLPLTGPAPDTAHPGPAAGS